MTLPDRVRLSVPGERCTHCGTKMTYRLLCHGCGQIDPPTYANEGDRVVRKAERFKRVHYAQGRKT